jgi:hypothetical protein
MVVHHSLVCIHSKIRKRKSDKDTTPQGKEREKEMGEGRERIKLRHARNLLQRHVDHIRDGLRIRRRAGSTAVDAVVDVGQFVCHAVGLFF